MVILEEPILFQWDDGNREKSLKKHSISPEECEEAFADVQKLTWPDIPHSQTEERYMLFGSTKQGHILTVVYTLREGYIRVISARPANKKERNLYHNYHEQKT